MDGQLAGGPFSSRPEPVAPTKPFMFVTKEVELHPDLAALFEQGGRGVYRVVVPAASHGDFADGAMFEPRLLPISGTAEEVIAVARGFRPRVLRQRASRWLGGCIWNRGRPNRRAGHRLPVGKP